VIFFTATIAFVFFFRVWLFSKQEIGSYRPIQKTRSRDILDVFRSYPMVVLVARGSVATMGGVLRDSKLSC
jgi:hypothetical protein